jgi:hypothetical protein
MDRGVRESKPHLLVTWLSICHLYLVHKPGSNYARRGFFDYNVLLLTAC